MAKSSSHFCDIPEYNFIHNHRKGRTGGGVGLYLNKEFEYKSRTDIYFSNNSAESLFVEIVRENEKNILVGVIYRPCTRSGRAGVLQSIRTITFNSQQKQ